jgi:hypothetical protein
MNWAIKLAEHWRTKEGIVNAFGVILYTDEHPHIKKVLADQDYWDALHEISGEKWAIFSIKPKVGSYSYPKFPPGFTGLMVPVWKEPKENKPVLQEFELGSTEDLPQLVIFTHDENEEILQLSIKLEDKSVEQAYECLRAVIKAVATAIEHILPENIKKGEGVYAALDLAVSSYKQWQLIKRGVNFYKWIKDLLP